MIESKVREYLDFFGQDLSQMVNEELESLEDYMQVEFLRMLHLQLTWRRMNGRVLSDDQELYRCLCDFVSGRSHLGGAVEEIRDLAKERIEHVTA